jgi:UDP-N-acetylmuramoylalanine--D-glutamate ligase
MFGTLTHPRVLILGLGESGRSMARWCLRHGARVCLADTRQQPPGLDALRAEFPALEYRLGELQSSYLDAVDIIGLSPGLSPYVEPLKTLIEQARERGVPVWSEIEFFAQALAGLQQTQGYTPRCVGITGTNGKTTVTALCAFLAQRSGLKAQAAGNISPAALDALSAALDAQALPDFWALELSSFQLETTHSLALDAATILNLSEDHLDWHPSMEQYAQAKARIYLNTRVRVANRDDALSLPLAMAGSNAGTNEAVITFGLTPSVQVDDWGLIQENGLNWLVLAEGDDDTPVKKKRGAKTVVAEHEPPRLTRLMPADALRLMGDHNKANALAALALVTNAGVSLSQALYALREFRGLPHRVEWLCQVRGVDYIEDSKGTNVGATVAALSGLKRRVVLIAGGEGKGQDFTPLVAPVRAYVRAVVLIGRDAPHVQAALAETGVVLETVPTLEQAVLRAAALAQAGDAVLLSPACASFDMFHNYEHRAQVFVRAVNDLALMHGEVVS